MARPKNVFSAGDPILAEEINENWIDGKKTIGITGATSTPKWLMEEIKEFIINKKYKLKTAI